MKLRDKLKWIVTFIQQINGMERKDIEKHYKEL